MRKKFEELIDRLRKAGHSATNAEEFKDAYWVAHAGSDSPDEIPILIELQCPVLTGPGPAFVSIGRAGLPGSGPDYPHVNADDPNLFENVRRLLKDQFKRQQGRLEEPE
jgi:hypothetical protein